MVHTILRVQVAHQAAVVIPEVVAEVLHLQAAAIQVEAAAEVHLLEVIAEVEAVAVHHPVVEAEVALVLPVVADVKNFVHELNNI